LAALRVTILRGDAIIGDMYFLRRSLAVASVEVWFMAAPIGKALIQWTVEWNHKI
jgi:hypothetical protein